MIGPGRWFEERDNTNIAPMAYWYLEGFVDERRETWRTKIDAFPFRVGRRDGSSLRLVSPEISGMHAELLDRGGELVLRDLGSKNGSFVNDRRIVGEQTLAPGDVIRFATREFRLGYEGDKKKIPTQTVALPTAHITPGDLARRVREIQQVLEERRFVAHFQPIVRLDGLDVVAYEALGRGLAPDGTPVAPIHLFELAAGLDEEADLSRVLRDLAVEAAALLPWIAGEPPSVFVNTHPAELTNGVEALLESLGALIAAQPPCRLVLEIHEAAVADSRLLRTLGRGIDEIGIDLAFDDFGTGQARLLELAEVAPRYIKFDRAWITGLDRVSGQRRGVLEQLVTMVRRLGVSPLAEGVETEGEASVCRELGFELAQGFLYGRPAPPPSVEMAEAAKTAEIAELTDE